MKAFLVLVCAFLALEGIQLYSQENFPGYGIFGSFNLNDNSYELRQLAGSSDTIPRFAYGNNSGFSIGAFYELPLAKKLYFSGRLSYSKNVPEVSGDVPFGANTNEHHRISANFNSIDLALHFRYKFFFGFSFLLGGSFSLLLDNNYTHEVTTQDSTLKILRVQTNNIKGEGTPFRVALSGGANYEIPLDFNGRFLLVPELVYDFGLAQFDKNMRWDANTLHIGLSLKYSPERYSTKKLPQVEPKLEEKPQPPSEKPKPKEIQKTAQIEDKVAIKAYSVNSAIEQPFTKLKVEEFVSTSIPPLLNYVFFDNNSAQLPARYTRFTPDQARVFHLDNLYNLPTLSVYYHILNIIGRRLTDHPKATITLIGCNADTTEEKGNTELSRNRAQTISDYLVKNWGIEERRIKIQARNLPEKPSNSGTPDGSAENRRVEIISDTWEIIAPVVTNSTLLETTPKVIGFTPEITGSRRPASYKLSIIQAQVPLKTISGEGDVPKRLDWEINKEKLTIPHIKEPVTYTFELYDSDGKIISSAGGRIEMDYVTINEKHLNKKGDKKIDKYGLILFDFAQYSISEANKRIIKFIKDRLEKNSDVTIEGFTDRTGEEDYNLQLSQQRAKSVQSTLNIPGAGAVGFGESQLLYDNELPEGRFYCRTVEIRVETPF